MADVEDADISTLLEEGMRHYVGGSPAKALELWYRVLDLEPRHPKALEYVQYLRDNLHVDVREPGFGAPATTKAPNGDAAPDWAVDLPAAEVTAPAADAPVVAPADLDAVGPDLAATGAEPVAPAPEPVVSAPEPVAPAPEPVVSAPEPVAPAPDPVASAPEPVASAPEPVAPAPEPVVSAPEPVAPAPEPVARIVDAAAAAPEVVAAPTPSATAPALAGGWGDLAFGDLDLDPNTGKAVERAPESDDVRQRRRQLEVTSPAAAVVAVEPAHDVVSVPEAPAVEPAHDVVSAPEAPAVEPAHDVVSLPEAPAIEMTPLPVPATALDADALADVGASLDVGALADVALPEPRPVSDLEDEALSPWDGPSGLTEPVDLDVSPMGPSTMDLVLAGTARRPHADGGLRAPSASSEAQAAPGSDDTAEPQSEVAALMEGARDLFQLGDFSGSLELVEKVLRQEPDNDEARAYLTKNESTLLQMYESKLGDLKKSPRVLTSPDEVIWMNLHHRAGFVLSQVDGELSYEDIAAISGMSRFETFRILAELIQNGVIG